MGYIQVYTGPGKGKTTAAIGLAIRALGAGKRVYFLQFMKEKRYSEHAILANLSDRLTLVTAGKPYFIVKKGALDESAIKQLGDGCVVFEEGNPPPAYLEMARDAMALAKKAVCGGDYDLVVLDELNCALFFGLVSVDAALELIRGRAQNTEVVFTGRGAPAALVEVADLVTEFTQIKHYYDKGVAARKGIEM